MKKSETSPRDTLLKKLVRNNYKKNGRHELPWRHDTSPYSIVISEIMLQQTQVSRVIGYYAEWIKRWPDFESLASATRSEVLLMWKGLGYNNRAMRLHKLSEIITGEYRGKFPNDPDLIKKLPGIGPYTAAAIMNFSFKKPTALIETNIRRVYLHHYFKEKTNIHDKQIMPIILRTMDTNSPDTWFWSLMDYGASLPKIYKKNDNKKSAHYTKQTAFEGSDRQYRSKILEYVLIHHAISIEEVLRILDNDEERSGRIIASLVKDGLLTEHVSTYVLNNA